MSDYLSRLVARNFNLAELVQPRLWSLFEPRSADGGPVFEQHFASRKQNDVSVSDETEFYSHMQVLPSSSILNDHSIESVLSEEVRTENIGTVHRKAAAVQPPSSETILNKSLQNPEDARAHPSNSETASPDRRQPRSTEVMVEMKGTVHRKAVAVQSPPSKTILSKSLQDQNMPKSRQNLEEIEAIPSTFNGETQRTESQSFTRKISKKGSPDRQQREPLDATVRTETARTSCQKPADSHPNTPETILDRPLIDPHNPKGRQKPEKIEGILVTSSSETQRTESQSFTRKISKKVSPDRQQRVTLDATVRTERARTSRRKPADSHPTTPETILDQPSIDPHNPKGRQKPEKIETIPVTFSGETQRTESQSFTRKISKKTSPKRQQLGPLDATERTETAGTSRQKPTGSHPTTPETILDRPSIDPHNPKRRQKPEKIEAIPVSSSGETQRTKSQSSFQKVSERETSDQQQRESTAVTIRTGTFGPVRRKALNVPSPQSETIPSQPFPDSEKTERWTSYEIAKKTSVPINSNTQNTIVHRAVKADLREKGSPLTSQTLEEAHPHSRKVPFQSDPERYPSPKGGIYDEKRSVPCQNLTEEELLPGHSSRAAVIVQPKATRFMEPTKQTTPQPAETKPTIKVTVGRVEVRAVAPTAPASPPPRIPSPSSQKLSLDDYLRKRSGRQL